MKNIGQTSQLTGLSQRMLRYFEDQGLLKPNRSSAGNRLFSDSNIAEILRIRKLHELGFTYPEIRDLLDANEQELAQKGTVLLEKHHEAALDLQEKIQNLEMICFGEKRSPSAGLTGQRTLDHPHRTAYTLKGAPEVASQFQKLCNLIEGEFSYWKFSWLADHLKPELGEFTLYEIFEGSSLIAVFRGKDKLNEYETAWKNRAGVLLGARELGDFSQEDLSEFFSPQEIVIEQKFLNATGAAGFHVLLPYSAFFAALGKNDVEEFATKTKESDLSYRSVDLNSLEDFKLIAKWDADPSIRHLALPHRDEQSLAKCKTPEQIQEDYKKEGPFSPIEKLIILQDGQPIGHCSLILDPPHKLTKDQKVGWLGITIGEEKLRSKGLGKRIMAHLEKLSLKHGAKLVEVGVFEFNEAAQKLCRSFGYEEFGKMDRCTYWQGKYWADIRFRKKLG